MSVEAMVGWTRRNAASFNFVRSSLVLLGVVLVVAAPLCLLAVVMERTGSGGPWGVGAAALICLFGGWAAEGAGLFVHRAGSPLGALLAGMALRLLPPLGVCLVLAAQGSGRGHLAFVIYLLTFYLVTLALDTWWAVQRVSRTPSDSKNRPS